MAGSKTIWSPIDCETSTTKPIKNSTAKLPMTPVQPQAQTARPVRNTNSKPTVLGPVVPGETQ